MSFSMHTQILDGFVCCYTHYSKPQNCTPVDIMLHVWCFVENKL